MEVGEQGRTIPATLSRDQLRVEAGGAAEASLSVGPIVAVDPGEPQVLRISVEGLPRSWFSLAAEAPALRDGESARILFVVHPPSHDPVNPLGRYEIAIKISTDGSPTTVLSAIIFAIAAGAETLESKYMRYLPRTYQGDRFLSRFLLIFQAMLDPVEQNVDNVPNYLDPDVTPARFLPWLATWVGATLDPGLDEVSQRKLIRSAVELARWKGSRRGLREELRIRSGARPLIVENFDGLRIGQDAALGLNTHLGAHHEGTIAVTLAATTDRALAPADAERLVDEIKPAHVGHIVRVVEAPDHRWGNLQANDEGVTRG